MKTIIAMITVLTLIGGCSTTSTMSSAEKNDAYLDYVKTEKLVHLDKIRSFKFMGWQSLSNDFLIVSTSPKKKYLIEVNGFCPELNFAQAIIINQSSNSLLSTRFDSISVAKSPRQKCFIKSMYKVTKAQSKALSAIGNEEIATKTEKV